MNILEIKGVSYVAQGHPKSYFENYDHALEMAIVAEEHALDPLTINPGVALTEAKRLLDIAIELEQAEKLG